MRWVQRDLTWERTSDGRLGAAEHDRRRGVPDVACPLCLSAPPTAWGTHAGCSLWPGGGTCPHESDSACRETAASPVHLEKLVMTGQKPVSEAETGSGGVGAPEQEDTCPVGSRERRGSVLHIHTPRLASWMSGSHDWREDSIPPKQVCASWVAGRSLAFNHRGLCSHPLTWQVVAGERG